MATEEQQITELIHRWAAAVHEGDLDAVLADHADDLVMFDVPLPEGGVRGIDAYRATWPPFFAWQASGAVFEITELQVTAGADVAFAWALLRCGTPDELAHDPDRRLRLTLGLRKPAGRWLVTHEHHSFADALTDPGEADRQVRGIFERWTEATRAGDLDALMADMADDVVSYEHQPPLQHVGVDAVRASCARGLELSGPDTEFTVPDLQVRFAGDLAVTWGLNRVRTGAGDEIWSRGTRIFRREGDGWRMVHQHVSLPVG